tara:strand:+ start:236 stop:712 length:477 start_codon:yes stop_codon:yes gene_type:complete
VKQRQEPVSKLSGALGCAASSYPVAQWPQARLLALAAVGALLALPTQAAEWETDVGMSVGGYYSDNICLAPNDKEGKAVATARPDISVTGSGARGNVNLQAAVEYNSLGDSDLECETGQASQLSNRKSFIPASVSIATMSWWKTGYDWMQRPLRERTR